MMTRDWAVDAAEDAMLFCDHPVLAGDGTLVSEPTKQLYLLADRIRGYAAFDRRSADSEVDRESCKLCFGRGERTADGSNGVRVRCKTCDGTGHIARPAQPQPVAQGEAVAWQITDAKIGYWGTARNERTARDLIEQMTEAGYEPLLTPLYTIPTCHRVVPVEPTEAMLSNGWECMPDSTAPIKGGMDFVYYIYKAMLAAAPDAGGV